jgi:predicted transcriptional regulator
MGILDNLNLKSIIGNLDPNLLNTIIAKMGNIDFSPIVKHLEGKAAGDSKISSLVKMLKNLSSTKPQTADQLLNITKQFDATEITEALNKVEKDDIPGIQALSSALKTFIK